MEDGNFLTRMVLCFFVLMPWLRDTRLSQTRNNDQVKDKEKRERKVEAKKYFLAEAIVTSLIKKIIFIINMMTKLVNHLAAQSLEENGKDIFK